jgi:hypothetical protein
VELDAGKKARRFGQGIVSLGAGKELVVHVTCERRLGFDMTESTPNNRQLSPILQCFIDVVTTTTPPPPPPADGDDVRRNSSK